jgi:hypothetical protein
MITGDEKWKARGYNNNKYNGKNNVERKKSESKLDEPH